MSRLIKILLLALGLMLSRPVFGQNIFQKRSDLIYTYDEFSSVFVSDTGFFTYGNAIAEMPLDSNNNHSAERRLIFTWYDWQGNLVKQKSYVKNKTDYYAMWYDNNALFDHGFYHLGSLKDTFTINQPNTCDIIAAKFNFSGDTLWSRRFDSGNFDNGGTVLVANNKDCIGVGYSVLPNGKNASRAIRVDSLGNIIWNKIYSNTFGNLTKYGVKDNVGNFYLAGQASINLNFNPYSWRCMLLKIDSLGVQQWMKNIPGICGDYAGGMTLDTDGNILLGVSKCKEVVNNLAISSILSLYKINILNGDTIWHKEYPSQSEKSTNSTNFVEKLANGDILIGGKGLQLFIENQDTLFGKQTGVAIRTDSLGNMKWQRYYFYNVSDAQNTTQSQLNDGKTTPDGGFIFVGRTSHFTDYDDGWIIKTDANGCIDAGCINGIDELEEDDFNLFIYPNPAQEYVSIDLPITHNQATIQIINMQGQLVKTIAIKSGGLQRIDTAGLANGIYQLMVSSKGKLIGNEKLVIVK